MALEAGITLCTQWYSVREKTLSAQWLWDSEGQSCGGIRKYPLGLDETPPAQKVSRKLFAQKRVGAGLTLTVDESMSEDASAQGRLSRPLRKMRGLYDAGLL